MLMQIGISPELTQVSYRIGDSVSNVITPMNPYMIIILMEVKKYVRYIADRRLMQLNLQPMFRIEQNPLPWVEEMLNGAEHTNFFENRSTEYSRAAPRGTWDEAFS